jgi:short-subunit dehydrogenase involved in D-alanine esterification of teichoic acids
MSTVTKEAVTMYTLTLKENEVTKNRMVQIVHVPPPDVDHEEDDHGPNDGNDLHIHSRWQIK